MPKIKTQALTVDPKVGVTRVGASSSSTVGIKQTSVSGSPRVRQVGIGGSSRITAPGVQARGAGKAGSERHIDTGKAEIGKAIGQIAEVLAIQHESLRQANRDNYIMDMDEAFTARKEEYSQFSPERAITLLDPEGYHLSAIEGLQEGLVPEDTDERTKKELGIALRQRINQEKRDMISLIPRKLEEANKIAQKRKIDLDHKAINRTAPGNIQAVSERAIDAAAMDIFRNPNYSEDQKGLVRSAYLEDYTSHAFLKWFGDSPILATEAWETHEKFLKRALPTKYNVLNNKYKTTKDHARGDLAVAGLQVDFPNDPLRQAEALRRDPEKYYGAKGYEEDALSLSARLKAEHTFTVSEKARQDKITEEQVFIDADEKFRNPDTGVVNVKGYLQHIETEWRGGRIGKTAHDTARRQVLVGELSNEEYLKIVDGIDNGLITTEGQISQLLVGKNTKALAYLRSQLKGVQKDAIAGLYENQLTAAEETYKLRAAQESQDATLSNPLDKSRVNAFKNQLRAISIQNDWSSRDPRIALEAEKLMKGGYYKKITGEPLGEFTEGEPSGKLRALDFFSPTLEVLRTRRFEYAALEAEKVKDETETATGSSPAQQAVQRIQKYNQENPEDVLAFTQKNIDAFTKQIETENAIK